MTESTNTPGKTEKAVPTDKTPKKRIPKGQRTHVRRLKQEANKNVGSGGPPHR
jgi:hypothetical protein